MAIDLTYDDVLNDEINYYWIGHTKQFSSTRVCTDTLENAIEYARRSQPNYRPFYIIKAVTHFEIIGIVNKRGKFQGYCMDAAVRTIQSRKENR